MTRITIVSSSPIDPASMQDLEVLASSSLVSKILIPGPAISFKGDKIKVISTLPNSGPGMAGILENSKSDYILYLFPGERVDFSRAEGPNGFLPRMLMLAEETGAGLLYSDFHDFISGSFHHHPLTDYQDGSIRDNFNFGSMLFIAKETALDVCKKYGFPGDGIRWGALYDLRLKLSIRHPIIHIPEPLYTSIPTDQRTSDERLFDYVDPSRNEYQREMEQIASAHLKRTGAYLAPRFKQLPVTKERFPVVASIIISVRNRVRTIRDAVKSALSQKPSFEFNVILVDNHSTDGTTQILAEMAENDPRVIHKIPERTDLGIGGCWNEAIFSIQCGRYAVQLDSDDIYNSEHTLERIVAEFSKGAYATVIGSYTITNFELEPIPPGLINHREWTRENGRNNALRINGLGAPRAYYVPVLRKIGFPNVSYGEDYAVGLRICREYEIGRIYEPLYYARRWKDNSDARLDVTRENNNDIYKDRLRTIELLARQRMNNK